MTRPLKHDDQFKSIINEKIRDRFLYFFEIKVQSTAFCQKINLQKSLIISSVFDILLGICSILLFFHNIKLASDNYLYFAEIFFLFIGLFFGFLGIDCATTLRKRNMRVYYIWRVFLTFGSLFLELGNNFGILCSLHFEGKCGSIVHFVIIVIFFIVNMYFTRLSWSFYIRLLRGHELLIIHGKYLEMMMNEEGKASETRKFVPPEMLMAGKNSNEGRELTASKTNK